MDNVLEIRKCPMCGVPYKDKPNESVMLNFLIYTCKKCNIRHIFPKYPGIASFYFDRADFNKEFDISNLHKSYVPLPNGQTMPFNGRNSYWLSDMGYGLQDFSFRGFSGTFPFNLY